MTVILAPQYRPLPRPFSVLAGWTPWHGVSSVVVVAASLRRRPVAPFPDRRVAPWSRRGVQELYSSPASVVDLGAAGLRCPKDRTFRRTVLLIYPSICSLSELSKECELLQGRSPYIGLGVNIIFRDWLIDTPTLPPISAFFTPAVLSLFFKLMCDYSSGSHPLRCRLWVLNLWIHFSGSSSLFFFFFPRCWFWVLNLWIHASGSSSLRHRLWCALQILDVNVTVPSSSRVS